MKKIDGNAINLQALLSNTKFDIDYYQREYLWERKHVVKLIEDIVDTFDDSYKPEHKRDEVQNYDHYFLGSIVTINKDGRKYIVDGQQRITSLSLLLVYLYRRIEDSGERSRIESMIYSFQYGKASFNIDVEERKACMDALFTGNTFDTIHESQSVKNLYDRYGDVEEQMTDAVSDSALLYFVDWLIEKLCLVEVVAHTEVDAYIIFETMNDRGISLTPTDLLKGYLLSNIKDAYRRDATNQRWRKQITRLKAFGEEEDANAIKAWLRSQYAKSIREWGRGAKHRDYDRIGNEYHRWVRDQRKTLGLVSSERFVAFIEEDFDFYGRWYLYLRECSENLNHALTDIYYSTQFASTLQYPVLLAPLVREDSEEEIKRKLRVVSAFLDIMIARRIWNWRSLTSSNLQRPLFSILRDIRGCDVQTLTSKLWEKLDSEEKTFATHDWYGLFQSGANRRVVHYLLARITDYLDSSSGRESRYMEYMNRRGKETYEIEHIWAYHFDRHTDEFDHETQFIDHRNRLGGLLLLPKSFNASFGDQPYEVKREHYIKQNLLAQSLHESAYEHDPNFLWFIQDSQLPFEPHPEFRKEDLYKRGRLYQQIAEQVWSSERLRRAAES